MVLRDNSYLQDDKYQIIRVLGQGGFGITYLAEHTMLGKKVAIKEFFPKDFCDRDEATSRLTVGTKNNAETVDKLRSRFLKEAQNIAGLDNHPGIVKIHDIFEENDTAYYVMDFIDGENLNEIVKRNGQLSESSAIEYICKVADALEYIHARNMTHFDVKPANIIIRKSDNQPVLIDFGLSKQYDNHGDATSSLIQGVSHGYSPIELYNPGAVKSFSPQTDVYSLGATLYFLTTGKMPPTASTIICDGLNIPENLSPELCNVIRASMKFNRNERLKSASEFIGLLKNNSCCSGFPEIKSTPVTDDEPTRIIGAPQIISFTINPPSPYHVGDEFRASWDVKNCSKLFLNDWELNAESSSKLIRCKTPGQHKLTLRAVNDFGETSKNVDIVINQEKDYSPTGLIIFAIILFLFICFIILMGNS